MFMFQNGPESFLIINIQLETMPQFLSFNWSSVSMKTWKNEVVMGVVMGNHTESLIFINLPDMSVTINTIKTK